MNQIKKIIVPLVFLCFLLVGGQADAKKFNCSTSSGGLSVSDGKCIPFQKARLVKGRAIPPASAPERVKAVIRAANKIRNKPYRLGGGHSQFEDSAYDCSGAVSYALNGGNFLKRPLSSIGFFNWGKKGVGKWITVYTNRGHAYLVVAGLRFDTANTTGNGPGWSKSLKSTPGKFRARSIAGY